MVDHLGPDLWSKIVPRYESYNNALEQIKQDIYFSDFIKSVVASVAQQNVQNINRIQQIISMNQDQVFCQPNIYSLINEFRRQNIPNVIIMQVLERFSSLNLLGYLQFDKDANSFENKSKLKLHHPWEQTQKHMQLYECKEAIITEMTLETIRAKKEGKFLGQTLKGAFENRFAQRLYKFSRRLEVDKVGFTNKTGCAELLNRYVYPCFGNDIYALLLDAYFEFRGYNVVLNSGVMAAQHFSVNRFFDAHLI